MGAQRSNKGVGSRSAERRQSGWPAKAFKGGILGLIITIMSILAFAILVKKFNISDETISAVNQAIKLISIFMAAYASCGHGAHKPVLTGGAAGVSYVLLGYLTFSLIESGWGDGTLLLADLAMGAVVGMLTAVIFAKILSGEGRKKQRA